MNIPCPDTDSVCVSISMALGDAYRDAVLISPEGSNVTSFKRAKGNLFIAQMKLWINSETLNWDDTLDHVANRDGSTSRDILRFICKVQAVLSNFLIHNTNNECVNNGNR